MGRLKKKIIANKECNVCNKIIFVKNYMTQRDYNRTNYCSKKCRSIGHKKANEEKRVKEKLCEKCDQIFCYDKNGTVTYSNWKKKRFCSNYCAYSREVKESTKEKLRQHNLGKKHTDESKKKMSKNRKEDKHWNWKGGDKTVNCIICDKKFTIKQWENIKTCSKKCTTEHKSKLFSGSGNANYNPNRDEIINNERSYFEYKEFRRIVRERDNYKCQKCGLNKKIEVHHLINYKGGKENLHVDCNPENGVVLCSKCHIIFHQIYGKKNITKNNFKEFMNEQKI